MPTAKHPRYYTWQSATLVVFVSDTDRARAEDRARESAKSEGWVTLEVSQRDTLLEERVRREGGKVWAAFEHAKNTGVAITEFLDDPPFTTKGDGRAFAVPRLTESWFDRVVQKAGGQRLPVDLEGGRHVPTADYLLGDFVLELKDLQAEALEVTSRQDRLHLLLGSDGSRGETILLDPAGIPEAQRAEYDEIVRAPVLKRTKEASAQVRATIARRRGVQLRGGAIILNSGYGTLGHRALAAAADRAVRKSQTLKIIISVSAWLETNGFDYVARFAFEPRATDEEAIGRLRDAFWTEIDRLMTQWARSGFAREEPDVPPAMPVTFERAGCVFLFRQPQPPPSWPT